MNTCAISQESRAEENRQERNEARGAYIDMLAAEMILLGGECDPFTADALGEAISEFKPEAMRLIASLLRQKQHAVAGEVLATLATEYWLKQAESQAADAVR